MSSEPLPGRQTPQVTMAFDLFATRVLYIVTLGVASVSAVQDDLWWLLRAGKDIWRTHHVSLVDHYSYTAAGDYWSNHEWLWEACAYALHTVGGLPLLSAWTGLTIAATIVVLRHVSSVTGYVVPIIIAAAAPLMSLTWTIRPQVTSLLLFAVTMFLLSHRRELWIPPLFLVWANLHAQVVMGGVMLVVVTAGAAYEAVRSRTAEAEARAARLGLVLVTSALATLVTPLGRRLWTYVLDANGRPGQARIAEWASAFHPTLAAALLWLALAGAVVLGFRRRGRLETWSARVPAYAALSMTPLALLAVRNVPFFVAAALPLYLILLEFTTASPIGRVGHARARLAVTALLTAVVVTAVWAASPPRLRWTPVSDGLAEALRSCPGHLYNDYDSGAALIWWVPDVKVFVDNRQDPYPAEVIEQAADLDAGTYRAVFERWRIRCALVRTSNPLDTALRTDGWRPTYAEGSTAVLVPPSTPRATSESE